MKLNYILGAIIAGALAYQGHELAAIIAICAALWLEDSYSTQARNETETDEDK